MQPGASATLTRPPGASPTDERSTLPAPPATAPTLGVAAGERERAVSSRPALPGVATADGEYAVLVLRTIEELATHRAAWDGLAAAAVEPNPFYESWMLLPALREFGAGRDLEFVLVFGYADEVPGVAPVLCGLFPLERRRTIAGLPIRHRVGWRHDYCFSGVPLVRRGRERAVVTAFLDAMDAHRDGGGVVRLGQWPADGSLHAATVDALDRRAAAVYVRSRASRAVLRPAADADAYLEDALSPKRRKEFGRLERRITEAGEVRFDALRADGDVGAWLAEFVALEAKGWKGREGTAFRAREADARWLEEVVRAAFALGRLDALALRHDGRAIAMKLNFLAADGGFAFKIAFDEEWGKYSPGVLLELENVRRVHARADVRWMDSCADPHHPMANRLWSGRRVYEDFFCALRGGVPALALSLMPLGRWLRGAFRRRPAPPNGDRAP